MFQDGLSMAEVAAQEVFELPKRELMRRLTTRVEVFSAASSFAASESSVSITVETVEEAPEEEGGAE